MTNLRIKHTRTNWGINHTLGVPFKNLLLETNPKSESHCTTHRQNSKVYTEGGFCIFSERAAITSPSDLQITIPILASDLTKHCSIEISLEKIQRRRAPLFRDRMLNFWQKLMLHNARSFTMSLKVILLFYFYY